MSAAPPPPITSSLRADANAGRVALITGGGTGIGRSTALELAATGAATIICGRRDQPLRDTANAIRAAGGRCLAIAADIREPDQVGRVIDAGIERFGAIDVLVNNAGGQFSAPAEEISDNGWRAVQRLAVDATWTVTRTVATRSMIPRRSGLIVFVGFSPQRGDPGFAHACAARAAVANLASGLALEWSRYSIRSVCLAVGTILTEGLEQYGPADVERWRRAIPLGRLGAPEEVSGLVAFLASAGGAYITGTTIAVDGGADAWGIGALPPQSPEAPLR
ncbi:MAG: SDR family oxidoreductase [Solirubrobacteraceae bacterium]